MGIIEKIGKDLDTFDIVVALFCGDEKTKEWVGQFIKLKELKKAAQRSLILSEIELPYIDLSEADAGSCVYRKLSRDEAEEIERLYKMYEFSDRLVMISDDPQYGGLLNYVKTGLMTMEEVVQTFLLES